MTFPLTIRKAACINVARLKRKWFPDIWSRWLLHLVWTPAGNVPPTDHLKLTAAFTQSLKASRLSSGGGWVGGGCNQRWVAPRRKKVFVSLVSFPFHLPEHQCSDTRKGLRCMLSNVLSRIFFVARWLIALSWEEAQGRNPPVLGSLCRAVIKSARMLHKWI